MSPQIASTCQTLVALLLLVALIACGGVDDGTGPRTASVIVSWSGADGSGKIGAADSLHGAAPSAAPAVAPLGVPTDPTGVALGVTEVELFVTAGGEQLQFDAGGNIVESGGQPVYLTTGSFTLQLPHGSYDFTVEARDDSTNVLADGARAGVVIEAPTVLTIPLLSLVGTAALEGPSIVVPNQVIDVALLVHPPERSDLIVPTGDYTVNYDTEASVDDTSQRGLRLTVECEPINVTATVTAARGGEPVVAQANIGRAEVCSSYQGGIGIDLLPPHLTIDPIGEDATVDEELTLSGTVNDGQSGVASVEIYDGPISLGFATIDEDSGNPRTWQHTGFIPDELREYRLSVVANDNAGNEARSAITVDVLEWAGLRFTSLASGTSHSCAIEVNGSVYCWGTNSFGQLGDGTTTDRNAPTRVVGTHIYDTITAGQDHTCAITNGSAHCWGANFYGQLGDGTTAQRITPTPVISAQTYDTLSAGQNHTCGLTNGIAYCWGSNDLGQLGDGTTTNRTTPTPVTGATSYDTITAGYDQTCGLTNGIAHCWGANGAGQIGDGTLSSARTSPTPVAGAHNFSMIAIGLNHTCGLAGGEAFCWGWNGYGRLGDGTLTHHLTPTLVTGEHIFNLITTGHNHTCGITNGITYCWGNNSNGQLGVGYRSLQSITPTRVTGAHAYDTITAGFYRTCALANGNAYCWGRNDSGQLGDGTTVDRSNPVKVIDP